MQLTTIALILLGLALALGAGWWLGRRRGSTIESERDIALDRAMEQLDRRFDDLAGRQQAAARARRQPGAGAVQRAVDIHNNLRQLVIGIH